MPSVQPMPTDATRNDVQRLLAEGAQLVEVLPRVEYEEEHLPGAINLPLKELDRQTAQRLDIARPVIVYCYDST
jgi:rhodanese-related sulfurtransferase